MWTGLRCVARRYLVHTALAVTWPIAYSVARGWIDLLVLDIFIAHCVYRVYRTAHSAPPMFQSDLLDCVRVIISEQVPLFGIVCSTVLVLLMEKRGHNAANWATLLLTFPIGVLGIAHFTHFTYRLAFERPWVISGILSILQCGDVVELNEQWELYYVVVNTSYNIVLATLRSPFVSDHDIVRSMIVVDVDSFVIKDWYTLQPLDAVKPVCITRVTTDVRRICFSKDTRFDKCRTRAAAWIVLINHGAYVIQRAWRSATCDPQFAMCRARILREYDMMQGCVQP